MLQTDDLLPVPFVDGGRSLTGFDCYGLSMEMYRRFGIELPDYKICCEDASAVNTQINNSRLEWVKCEGELPVPCLVVMQISGTAFCNHTGVYLGNGKFIHTREKVGVSIDRIDSMLWKRRIEGFYTLRS
jgi:cell wall-associated NlpC family hydrolase